MKLSVNWLKHVVRFLVRGRISHGSEPIHTQERRVFVDRDWNRKLNIRDSYTGVLICPLPDQEWNKIEWPNSYFCKPLRKISEDCPSNQVSAAAMTSASDEKWRPFNCFFQSGRAKDLSAPRTTRRRECGPVLLWQCVGVAWYSEWTKTFGWGIVEGNTGGCCDVGICLR